MTIFCKICGQKFDSNTDKAQAEVIELVTKHIMSCHQEQAVALHTALVTAIPLTSVYLVKKYIRVPPEEVQLLHNLQKDEMYLYEIFGIHIATETTN